MYVLSLVFINLASILCAGHLQQWNLQCCIYPILKCWCMSYIMLSVKVDPDLEHSCTRRKCSKKNRAIHWSEDMNSLNYINILNGINKLIITE